MIIRTSLLTAALACGLMAHAQERTEKQAQEKHFKFTVERLIPVEFLGTIKPFVEWDSTAHFRNERTRTKHGLVGENEELEEVIEGRRGHPAVDHNAQPQGLDPAWQTAPPSNGFDRALDLSVNGMGNTGVSPADPCLSVGPNHVIQMINGSSGAYFRIYDKTLANPGAQTYMDNFVNAIGSITTYSGLGDPIVLYDALADRWVMTEFSDAGNRMIVAVSTTASPTGSWYAYSYTAPGFPDYPKYAVWSDCYVVTTNETTPAIYALPRANMLAGTGGTAARFTIGSLASIGFQAATPVHFGGGTPPPAGAPAMFMRMVDDLWTAAADVDRLELWNINYNAVTPASSTITGPTAIPTAAFDSDLCGYSTLNCITQPGTQTMDPIREVLMNRICYRNLNAFGYEAIALSHSVDLNLSDRACPRWYELHRTGGTANPWSIYQQGTYSPDANDRWMPTVSINNNGDIGLVYNIAGTTGGNVYPGIRYTGRYRTDALGTMTFAETSIVAGTASNNSNRYGDYSSLDVDPADGTSFYGTAMYNPAVAWSTRMFKFSFPAVGCTAPTVSQATTDNCGAGTFNVAITIGSNGDAPNYDLYTSVNGGAFTFNSNRVPGTYTVGTYAFGTSVVVQVRHTVNALCNQQLTAVTSNGTACCTAPAAVVTGNCLGSTSYSVSVNLSSIGSATSIAIQIDPDAGGPLTATTVQTVTAPGSYGPFGSYTSASPVNVVLVHNVYSLCNLAFNNFVKDCNAPGVGCGLFTNNTVATIVDNGTLTRTIVVPSQSGATITDLNVYVNLTHTWVSDVRLSLTSPGGTTVSLLGTGVCADQDNINVEFDQTGANGAVGVTCPLNNLFVIPTASLAGFNGQLFEGTWTLTVQDVIAQDGGTLNTWCLIPTLLSPTVRVSPKVFLEGPFTAGLMSDALRAASLIPGTEPYSAMGYAHSGGGGGETVAGGILATTGNNAIVDWVLVELRNSANSAQVLASRSALLQRDGDVVDVDGTSGVFFNRPPGSYFVAVRHRNHLGLMSASAVALTGTTISVNFTLSSTLTFGTAARKDVSGVQVMWAGNVVFDTELKYTGSNNDRDPILSRIGGVVPTATLAGYFVEDVNLSGIVQYTGGGNDRDPILVNIGGVVPTATRAQQLP